MNPSRYDSVARTFADRRASRRTALAGVGVGLATAAIGAGGLRAAQDAAPAATPAAGDAAAQDKQVFLFVQSFRGGALSPKEDPAEGGASHTLTLSEGLGQTIYFADRPDRTVGAVSTPQFLDGLGFPPGNPPNAALVADLGNGDEEILIVELLNPAYEEATHSATYDVVVLQDHERVNMAFVAEPHAGGPHPGATYGASHLFIDDCADDSPECNLNTSTDFIPDWHPTGLHVGPVGYCWSWDALGCVPCWNNGGLCNTAYPDVCNERCGTLHLH